MLLLLLSFVFIETPWNAFKSGIELEHDTNPDTGVLWTYSDLAFALGISDGLRAGSKWVTFRDSVCDIGDAAGYVPWCYSCCHLFYSSLLSWGDNSSVSKWMLMCISTLTEPFQAQFTKLVLTDKVDYKSSTNASTVYIQHAMNAYQMTELCGVFPSHCC